MAFAKMRLLSQEPDVANEQSNWMIGPTVFASFLHAANFTHRCEEMATLMAQVGLSYKAASATWDSCKISWIRPRGDTTMNVYYTSTEHFTWQAQMCYVLMAKDPGVLSDEIIAGLPTVTEVILAVVCWDEMMPSLSLGNTFNVFCVLAAVCEKLGSYERALGYADAGLSPDLTKGGTPLPISRAVLCTLRGRVLASLGRSAEAGEALEAAAEEAHKYGLFLYEAFALRDLKTMVLDAMGHGESGSRRLGAALRQLKSPAETLTSLMNGLDAAELMAMGAPEPGSRVPYPSSGRSGGGLGELRAELLGMNLMRLQKRAVEAGVAAEVLEAVIDSDAPKAGLVALLVQREDAAGAQVEAAATRELRAELEGMGLFALQQRAAKAGVDDIGLEAAMDSDAPKAGLVALIAALETDLE